MRKLKLQVQITLDGFIAGPSGEMDWMTWNWDEKLKSYVTELTAGADTIVLGRKLAEGFIPHWSSQAGDPSQPEHEAGIVFSSMKKVVFTRTLTGDAAEEKGWKNTVIAQSELKDEIGRLKSTVGKDIIAYGGAAFVSSLISEGLIDDFYLFINPVALGHGLPVFAEVQKALQLSLTQATSFECGIIVAHYKPVAA